METKKQDIDRSLVAALWPHDEFEFLHCSAATNQSGGVIVVWNREVFEMKSCHKGCRWTIVEGMIKEEKWECSIGVLYGGNARSDRKEIYEELLQIKSQMTRPLLIMGDFNEVVNIEERKGQRRVDGSMREFRRWIDDSNLIDIPLQTKKYTWSRGMSMSKLDRFLCEGAWLSKFPDLSIKSLNRRTSDHNPLLLNLVRNYQNDPNHSELLMHGYLILNFKKL